MQAAVGPRGSSFAYLWVAPWPTLPRGLAFSRISKRRCYRAERAIGYARGVIALDCGRSYLTKITMFFQLYSAATPSAVRFGTGMTLGQWTDSRERVGNRAQEEVYEVEGRIMAWLGSDLGGCIAHMELMIDPDYQEMLGPMMDHALAGHGIQSWLVPEYQNTLRNSLIYRGFVEVAHYTVLIKTMAARVNRPSVAHVEARVW